MGMDKHLTEEQKEELEQLGINKAPEENSNDEYEIVPCEKYGGYNVYKNNNKVGYVKQKEKGCQFAKYGFEVPEFECEIVKVFNSYLMGYAKAEATIIPCVWYKKTGNLNVSQLREDMKHYEKYYSLTPIKKPWYEDESNIGKIVSYDVFDYTNLGIFKGQDKDKKWLQILALNGDNCVQKTHKVRPATKEEALSLVGEE